MSELRKITEVEIAQLALRGCVAEDWSQVLVSQCFTPSQLYMARLGGRVEIHARAQIFNSTVINYILAEESLIDSVMRLECTERSSFGNGVEVASLNECGGRAIKIYETMSSQVAYIATQYRHRAHLIERLDAMATAFAASKSSTMGRVGSRSQLLATRIVRNVAIGDDVRVEGASTLSCGTLLSTAKVGADVKAHNFIAVEGSLLDNGASIERCFVGENVIISNGFTAVDSLFFASSHLENGEAASIFAGPYTVSHHKSSLLIAGMFSFFNAGSGSNQSNHLFKCGPVHQGVHMRGCKFGSSAYVMLPAINGAYTSVIGSHSSHHDSSDFPFSYLINKEGRSTLIPAANLSSYGYVRDIAKWVQRDRRTIKRDTINFEEYNPYITSMMINAVNVINTLLDKSPDAASYTHKSIHISANNLKRGLATYNKAIAAAIGGMLSGGEPLTPNSGRGRWVDLSGQYITRAALDQILGDVERGEIESLEQIDSRLREFNSLYPAVAYDYALALLTELLGHTPSDDEIEQTKAAALSAAEQLAAMAQRDMQRDMSLSMAVSYGIDSDSAAEVETDFKAVRGL